jgi:formylglycine-generating enzyme required for sulfatase activity
MLTRACSLAATGLLSVLLGLLLNGLALAQDADIARKKCVDFGFQANTNQHAECVKQFLQSSGGTKPPAKADKIVRQPVNSTQLEEKFWDAAMSIGNRAAFEGYLQTYPRGRYVALARASLERLSDAVAAHQQALAEAAEKLATERAVFEAEQKLARERAAAEAAQRVAAAEAARRAAANPRPGQVIKDCADCPEMVAIPGGSFVMGADKNNDEKPPHPVTLRSFLMGKTEVTHGQWKVVMGSNPSRFSQCGDDCPVEQVSWNDAQAFIGKLNQKTGLAYRLPSEAEWEYAARAGSTTEWSFGDSENQLGEYAWYAGNSQSQSQRVTNKIPNAFGLFDMHGNVRGWVQDCWHGYYIGAPTDGSAWTTGCSGDYRVLRGGSWGSDPAYLRSAIRSRFTPDGRYDGSGFRLARTP